MNFSYPNTWSEAIPKIEAIFSQRESMFNIVGIGYLPLLMASYDWSQV